MATVNPLRSRSTGCDALEEGEGAHRRHLGKPDSRGGGYWSRRASQDVCLVSRYQDLLFPSRHQPSLRSPALSREEDCSGHRRGSPRHRPADRHTGSSANPARLPAPDRPDQLQALLSLHARGPGLSHGGGLHTGGSRSDGQVPVSFRSRTLREIQIRPMQPRK